MVRPLLFPVAALFGGDDCKALVSNIYEVVVWYFVVIYPTRLFRMADDFVALIKLACFEAKFFGFEVLNPLDGSNVTWLSKSTGRVAYEFAVLLFLLAELVIDSFLFIARRL